MKTLILDFEKVAPYTLRRNFSGEGMLIDVYTDFGHLRLTLHGSGIGKDRSNAWFTDYVDSPYLFIEEEFPGEITFWNGEYEDRYDWTSDGGIPFESKVVEHLPISADEWKEKYVAMTLHWDKLAQERLDILHQDFLKDFIAHTKNIIGTILPDTDEPNKVRLYLNQELNNWFETHERMIKDHAKAMAAEDREHQDRKENQETLQQEVNKVAKSFWQRLFNR